MIVELTRRISVRHGIPVDAEAPEEYFPEESLRTVHFHIVSEAASYERVAYYWDASDLCSSDDFMDEWVAKHNPLPLFIFPGTFIGAKFPINPRVYRSDMFVSVQGKYLY